MQRPLKESSAFLFLTSYSPYIRDYLYHFTEGKTQVTEVR